MTTDRPTPPTEERAREDADLGFPPELADHLRTTMTTAVADVGAPADLYDEVRSRHQRRRWATRAAVALAGTAAVVVIALAVQAVTTSAIVVDADPADSPVTEPATPTVLLDEGVSVPIPAFELAGDDDGLYLLERGPDGEYVERRTVLSTDELRDLLGPGGVNGVWVRPGSTVADLQAVLAVGTFSVGEPRLVTIRMNDGGASASHVTWEGEPQLTGSVFEFAAAWSPDGSSFAYNVFYDEGPKEIVVLDVDDDGRPTVAGRAPADPSSFLAWVDGPEDDFSLWTQPGDVATRWTRTEGGRFERLGPDERPYVLPLPPGASTYASAAALPTSNGIVETLGGSYEQPSSDEPVVRLLDAGSGAVLATVELPPEVGPPSGMRLSTVGGAPVLNARHGYGEVVIAPTADGELEVAVLPAPEPSTYAVDWVD